MFRHHRICCVCNIPGKAVQIHHIDDNPANNDPANLAVLCLECHNDTQVAGGFGRKLRASEVIKHRDDWIQRVKERKTEVDRILVARMADVIKVEGVLNKPWEPPSGKALLALIRAFTEKTESRDSPAGTNRIQGLCWSGGQHGWRNRIRRICVRALLGRDRMALPSRKLRSNLE